MKEHMAQKVELARMMWYDGTAEAAVSELLDERRRIGEVAAVLRLVLENAVAIFEEEGGAEAEGEYGWGMGLVWLSGLERI